MRIKTSVLIITIALSLLPLYVAFSHDIWFSPERFTLSRGDTLTVHQLAGHELKSELELPLLINLTPRFELVTPEGSFNLLNELPDASTS